MPPVNYNLENFIQLNSLNLSICRTYLYRLPFFLIFNLTSSTIYQDILSSSTQITLISLNLTLENSQNRIYQRTREVSHQQRTRINSSLKNAKNSNVADVTFRKPQ